jgi:predicted transport protein
MLGLIRVSQFWDSESSIRNEAKTSYRSVRGHPVSDLKIFRITNGIAEEVIGGSVALERSLQTLIEANMETLFGVRFVATEFTTGQKHRGRIDSLGLDENGSPVIFEYKRSLNENVINQGLFYLDWLLDHRGDFTVLVQQRLGSEVAKSVDFANPRLVCVAIDFTRYDEHAIAQINRSIELVRYRDYQGSMLALDLVSKVASTTDARIETSEGRARSTKGSVVKTVTQYLDQAPVELKDLYGELDAQLVALGDDVTKKATQLYIAYRRIKNFACVEVHPQSGKLLVFVKVNPDSVPLVEGFTRDVRHIGHFGTGDLEITLKSSADLAQASQLIALSYQSS